MSMSNSMYGYRRCCGDHFHVTAAGEDLIGGRFETEGDAKNAADLLNAGATLDSVLVGTDAPKSAPSPHGQDVDRIARKLEGEIALVADLNVCVELTEQEARALLAALRGMGR